VALGRALMLVTNEPQEAATRCSTTAEPYVILYAQKPIFRGVKLAFSLQIKWAGQDSNLRPRD
jgi:hypothetical protein